MKHESKIKTEAAERKIFLSVLNGKVANKVPFWFMRQAGRYLPEYRELRAKKKGFLAMAMDPQAACEVTLQPIRRFGMDAAIIFSDILTVPYALGQDLQFVEGEGPKLPPLESVSHIEKLSFEKFDEKLEPVYEALKTTRSALAREGFHETALIGFAGAPWTVATYMIEGGSSRTFSKAKAFMRERPAEFQRIIDLLVEATSRYLIAQVEAGAEALQIFDSWAGTLKGEDFENFSIAPTKKIVAAIHARYPHVPIIGFPKGARPKYLLYAEETGISAIGLDPDVPLEWAAKNLQPLMPVQGNLDPLMLQIGGDGMKVAARHILKILSPGPFIFNLGHGIHKDTPVKNVEELVALVKDFRR